MASSGLTHRVSSPSSSQSRSLLDGVESASFPGRTAFTLLHSSMRAASSVVPGSADADLNMEIRKRYMPYDQLHRGGQFALFYSTNKPWCTRNNKDYCPFVIALMSFVIITSFLLIVYLCAKTTVQCECRWVHKLAAYLRRIVQPKRSNQRSHRLSALSSTTATRRSINMARRYSNASTLSESAYISCSYGQSTGASHVVLDETSNPSNIISCNSSSSPSSNSGIAIPVPFGTRPCSSVWFTDVPQMTCPPPSYEESQFNRTNGQSQQQLQLNTELSYVSDNIRTCPSILLKPDPAITRLVRLYPRKFTVRATRATNPATLLDPTTTSSIAPFDNRTSINDTTNISNGVVRSIDSSVPCQLSASRPAHLFATYRCLSLSRATRSGVHGSTLHSQLPLLLGSLPTGAGQEHTNLPSSDEVPPSYETVVSLQHGALFDD